MFLEPYSVMIIDMAKQGLSSAEISARISHESGGARGCSARNVRRFCAEKFDGTPRHAFGVRGGKSYNRGMYLLYLPVFSVCVCVCVRKKECEN